GHEGGGHDHHVALAHADPVVAVGDAAEGGHRLALAAGAYQHHALIGEVVDLADVDQGVGRHLQVPHLRGDGHVAHHGAPHEGDLAVVGRRRVEHLLDPVDVAGEGCHHDLLLGAREDRVQHRPDLL